MTAHTLAKLWHSWLTQTCWLALRGKVGRGARAIRASASQAAREASTESSEFVAAARAVTEGRASANALELLEAMGYELVEATVIVGYEYEAPPGGELFLRLCRRLTPERPRDADSAQLSGAEPWVLEAVAGGADVWAAAAALEAIAALLADFVTLKPPAGAIHSTKGGAKGGAKRKR